MIKMICIIDNLYIGGAQSHLLKLVNTLGEKGHSVDIFCLGGVYQDFVQHNSDVSIHFLKMDYVWQPIFWTNFLKLIGNFHRIKPLIVHTYLDTANVFGVLAARMAKVPVIISSRRDAGIFSSDLMSKLQSFTARLSDKVVCVSEAIKDIVIRREKLAPSKVVVIYNGVDIEKFKVRAPKTEDRRPKTEKDCFVVTMVASIDRKEKGHHYFVEAARILIGKRKDVRFVLIGDGPLRKSIERLISEKKVTEYFELRGRCTQLDKELANTDLLVVPSESEGCSNALLEAMAMGIPPVATAVEGNLEVIEDGVSGFLVRPKDPQAIADKILELLSAPERLKEAGRAARERILAKFTLERMVQEYVGMYEGLLNYA